MPVTFLNLPNTLNAPDGSPPSSAYAVNHPTDAMAAPNVTDNPTHGQNDPFRTLAIAWLAVQLIDAAPRRVRRAMKGQEDAVVRAIERYGFRVPILVRKKTGSTRYEVVDGHTRLAAARRLGADSLPCILVDDLPEIEIRRLRLSLNKLQETGDWDRDALSLEIGEILEIGGDFQIPGFELAELEALCAEPADGGQANPDDDMAPLLERTGPVVTQPGDLWVLGDHKLFCGSARDDALLTALLGGRAAAAVFTDPPYNVKINGHVRGKDQGFEEFAEASGEMSDVAFTAFLLETLGNMSAALRPGGVIFACIDWRHVGAMTGVLETLGLELLNICVWVKTNPGMGSLYRSQHEFVTVARKPGASHTNNVQLGKFGRTRSNVWHYAGATGGRVDSDDVFCAHPTVKPIRLVMDALLDVTEPGDLVVDLFLGSGTTLLAAERTRRRCVGVEIEPRYVDLSIRRWQEMTGGRAILAVNGETFEERAATRRQESADTIAYLAEDF
ncbi:DNA modification methylase [Roseovarius azorensis]|uniref:Methyltransferase n=1 Tax=Roseovarius azorensis TaxID=1287727 RepID=A0A1H7HWY9_9RHOB|nr:DNA modification methylase [Roseovarius azorensis]SEK54863.1 DNA modification methylase [Roseovarius azorensis]